MCIKYKKGIIHVLIESYLLLQTYDRYHDRYQTNFSICSKLLNLDKILLVLLGTHFHFHIIVFEGLLLKYSGDGINWTYQCEKYYDGRGPVLISYNLLWP